MLSKNNFYVVSLLLVAVMLTGCSVKRAASSKSLNKGEIMGYGRDRNFVLSQLGQPKNSIARDNGIVDEYVLQRNSTGWGVTRAGVYSVLDLSTLGLWELIGTPLEEFVQVEELVTIEYDENNQIRKVSYLQY
ncbi:MAG: hypothetical protein KBD53_08155 [Candidatus Omnitrophica bacterium]|nr:hypothetical protein [Candidatus Omnitrophota bacterium]